MRDIAEISAGDLMSNPAVAMTPDTSIEELTRLMTNSTTVRRLGQTECCVPKFAVQLNRRSTCALARN
jgi:hypothetical protein